VTDQNQSLPAQGSDANKQGDHNNNNQSMESLLQSENMNVDMPQQGEIRTGTIASVSPSQILVSVGAKSEGVISGKELEQLSAEEREALKVGAEIPVYVVNPEDDNGNVVLSFRRAQEQISWENVEKMLRQQNRWLQQRRLDRFGGRLARFCSFIPDQCDAPRSIHRRDA